MKRIFIILTAVILAVILCLPSAALCNDGDYISGISPDTTLSSLKSTLRGVTGAKRGDAALGGNSVIATGDILEIAGETRVASVTGDADCNGRINAADYLMIKRKILNTYKLEGERLSAADADFDGNITASDYVSAKKALLGTTVIGDMSNASGVAVLLYHHIVPDDVKATHPTWRNNSVTSSVGQFTSHMKALKDNGYTSVSVDELIDYVAGKRTLPVKSVLICFDDGYRSNTYYAAPILREYGFKATVFTQMGYIDDVEKNPPYDVDKLQHFSRYEMEQTSDVLTFCSHTYRNHNNLTEQSASQVLADLQLSQNTYKSNAFAYPYGSYNASVINTVKAAGFVAAFTTVERKAKPGDNLFEIPRYSVTPNITDATLLTWVG